MADDGYHYPETAENIARHLTREERKQIVKEALKEFLREQLERGAAGIGRWFVRIAMTLILISVTYLVLWAHGWIRP